MLGIDTEVYPSSRSDLARRSDLASVMARSPLGRWSLLGATTSHLIPAAVSDRDSANAAKDHSHLGMPQSPAAGPESDKGAAPAAEAGPTRAASGSSHNLASRAPPRLGGVGLAAGAFGGLAKCWYADSQTRARQLTALAERALRSFGTLLEPAPSDLETIGSRHQESSQMLR